MWKNYKAIFFDWDGTAVMSRKAPADDAVQAMSHYCKRRETCYYQRYYH